MVTRGSSLDFFHAHQYRAMMDWDTIAVGHKYDGMSRLEFFTAICRQYGHSGLRAEDVLRSVAEKKTMDEATYASRIHDLRETQEGIVTQVVTPATTPTPDNRCSADLFTPYHPGLF